MQSKAPAPPEIESKKSLALGIPCRRDTRASSEEQAIELARNIGGSVVLKVYSETITHKSDVGGVKLPARRCSRPRAYREVERR